MKLTDYVAAFLANLGVRHAFVVQGGAVAHLIDSMAKTPGIDYVCVGHEQAGAIAVHGYAARNGGFGCAMATTGPGIINLINGIACLYYDSMPSIFIGGQVTTTRARAEELGVRQLGFQESPHAAMCAHVCKYSATVRRAEDIRYELEKAAFIARQGRPGPVFLDICDDVQRQDIDPASLRSFDPAELATPPMTAGKELDGKVSELLKMIEHAERPILALGFGVRLAGVEEIAVSVAEALGIPVAPSWGAMDFLPSDHPLNAGGFGVHSPRHGNFTVQNADLLIAVGIRLSQHQTGTPLPTFARGARRVVVDVDANELAKLPKLGFPVDLPVVADAGAFFSRLSAMRNQFPAVDYSSWRARVAQWKERYSIHRGQTQAIDATVNPYVFMKELSQFVREGDYIFSDVGATLSWTYQAFQVKKRQRMLTSFNNHTMGYALPAAIGASLADPERTVVSLNGDGSVLMNIQELGTLADLDLPVKVFILNNHGYGVIQQTQEDYFQSRYNGVTPASGLMDPDFLTISRGFGLPAVEIRRGADLKSGLTEVFASRKPLVCMVEIDPKARIAPAVKNMRPIEEIAPFLPPEELKANMIIPTIG